MSEDFLEEPEDLGRQYDWRLLARFLGYVRPHLGPVLATLAVILAGIAAELAAPFLLREALDGPVRAGDVRGVWLYGAAFAAIALANGLLETVEHYISNLAGQRIIHDMRTEAFAHLQRMSTSYFDRNPVGRLLTRVTSDVENLSELFTSGLVGILANFLFLAALLCAMFWLDWRLTLAVMATMPLVAGATWLFRRHARRTYRAARQAIAHMTAYLNESVGGIKTIQIFNRQGSCAAEFGRRNARYRDRSTEAAYVYSFFWPGVEFIGTLAVAVLLWRAGRGILEGTTTFGVFVAFWYLVRKFFEPIQELAEKYNILQAAMASSERLFSLLDTPPAVAPPASPASPPRRGEIEFRDVRFSYDGVTPVLKGVSFKVRPGEKLALVGYTGAGKTSILSLLLRLYDADSGAVLVDGQDVRGFDPVELRRRFGMVFQDVFLFTGTIAENLSFGDGVARERIRKALDMANARRVVERLPRGLDTELRERGAGLSTGERQLLSIARALVADPPVLVLDEATSSVDAETEGLLQDALDHALEGRTALIVAHRLSTVRRADRILVLHHGEVREEGTHEALLKRKGLYEKLYRLQWSPGAVSA